jgi:hypothetical protein
VNGFLVCFFFSGLKLSPFECTSFPFVLVFTHSSFAKWKCKLLTCKFICFFVASSQRLSCLFIWVVLLYFYPFVFVLLPCSFVIIWKSFFDFKQIFLTLFWLYFLIVSKEISQFSLDLFVIALLYLFCRVEVKLSVKKS